MLLESIVRVFAKSIPTIPVGDALTPFQAILALNLYESGMKHGSSNKQKEEKITTKKDKRHVAQDFLL